MNVKWTLVRPGGAVDNSPRLTLRRMHVYDGVVLTIHDTTELNNTGKKSLHVS